MATRSLTRELALLVLGQVSEQKSASVADLALDSILDQALDTLTQHWRESLDASAAELEQAQQFLEYVRMNSTAAEASKYRLYKVTELYDGSDK